MRYLGPISEAPEGLLDAIDGSTRRALQKAGWMGPGVLCFEDDGDFDVDLAVLARTHAWDDDSPLVWVVTTVGLSRLRQPFDEPPVEAGAFPHIELATVTNNMTENGPIPERLAVVLEMDEPPPGWDWEQVETPPLMEWLFYTAQNLASMMVRDGAVFRLGQYLRATGNPMPASSLLNALLLPACPQMLGAGLEPTANGIPVFAEDWWADPGFEDCDQGFVWLLPIDDAELEVVEEGGAGELLASFVERAEEDESDDLFSVAFDLMRRPE